MRSNSCLGSIVEHRQRLNKAFKDSPSLKPYYAEIFAEVYGEAKELVAAETGIDIGEFPVEVTFAVEWELSQATLRSLPVPDILF